MRQNSWEYKVVKLERAGMGMSVDKNIVKYQSQLNQLGKIGWELVTINDGSGYAIAYLRR